MPSYPFLQPPVEPDEIGRLGNYRVLRLLGKGGMAFVFLAEDVALRRRVALKVMRPNLDNDPDAWQRFLREARIMASVTHQHLVTVYQVGQEDGVIYLAMELLQGETLESWVLRVGPAAPGDVLRLGREIATGLAVLHGQGLVHRDVKPSNLWLEAPSGRVKVLDFGLARLVDDDANVTRSGTVVGTPSFMSPEQARGERADARSDLFSLGGVLYCLCTGTPPFRAANTMGVLTALAVSDPRPAHEVNRSLPRPLSDLVMRLLAKDPEERPATAEAVREELERIDAGLTPPIVQRTPASGTQVLSQPRGKKSRKKKAAVPHPRWLTPALAVLLLTALVVLAGMIVALALPRLGAPDGRPGAPPERPEVYLSGMQPTEVLNWIQQPPPPPPPPPGQPGRGPPPPRFSGVRVEGKVSPHGIFMHPPLLPNGGTTRLGYRLDQQYSTFQAEVSLNDGPPGSATPLTFAVYGDGQLLWKSREVRTQSDAQACSVSVAKVEVLTLEVNCPGRPHGAHAVWVEPRVAR